jgi:eukaryotic-like serine/threonine-protein kinase
MISPGVTLGGRYRLEERIAGGGMGDVWRGTDVVLGRVVAVKVLRPAMMADPEFAGRFYGEARTMAAFRHPGVVEVYDYASAGDSQDEDGCAYLVMAYVDGEPLSTRLKEAGRLGVDETMSVVAQVADALDAAHANGTVHRDVKPGNLIVRPNGAVILVDFGVARSNAVTSLTGVNSIVGTALYMAPEQVAKGNVTPATDIYALGAVGYHCLAGRPPFDGDNALQVALRHLEDEPDALPDDVPEPVRALISRAMAKHPADRFASAAEMATAAVAARGEMDWRTLTGTALIAPMSPVPAMRAAPVPPDAPTSSEPVRGRSLRSPIVMLLAVVALVVVASGLAVAIMLSGNDRPVNPAAPTQLPSTVPTETSGPAFQVAPTISATATRPPHRTTVSTRRPSNSPSSTPSSTPQSSPPSSPAPSSTAPSSQPTPTDTTPPPTPTDTTTAGTGGGGPTG